jgi:putative flippase GtrA
MKKIDLIFAVICGLSVSWLVVDFFDKDGWISFIVLPVFSVIGLWLVELTGRKFLFVHQAAKFFLIGALAAVVDIKIFQLSVWFFSFFIIISPLISKGVSFFVATVAKYWGNKNWAFEKKGKDGIKKEIVQFFAITLIGMLLDISAFYYFTKIMGPQFSMPDKVWTELSIIFSALVAAIWNFSGYKFFVFKK